MLLAKSPPGSCLDPALFTYSGLSGSHPIVLPATTWCYDWTGKLPLEGREGLGLRSLSALGPPGFCPPYSDWAPLSDTQSQDRRLLGPSTSHTCIYSGLLGSRLPVLVGSGFVPPGFASPNKSDSLPLRVIGPQGAFKVASSISLATRITNLLKRALN